MNALFSICYQQYHEGAQIQWRVWGCQRDVNDYVTERTQLPRYVMHAYEEGLRTLSVVQREWIAFVSLVTGSAATYTAELKEIARRMPGQFRLDRAGVRAVTEL